MATTPKTSKEELLVENAILKHNEQVRLMLKQELAPFSEAIKGLDKRLTKVEDDVTQLADVIAPFSAIKKRLWFVVIAASLLIGVVGSHINDWLLNIIKK